jgi:hypothetical protein
MTVVTKMASEAVGWGHVYACRLAVMIPASAEPTAKPDGPLPPVKAGWATKGPPGGLDSKPPVSYAPTAKATKSKSSIVS